MSSAVGTVVASTSMQFAYAGVPLSLSLLLNLANRRRIEVSTHRRAMGAVVRVQQQFTQDLAVIERRLREVADRNDTSNPTQSQIRLQQLHDLSPGSTPDSSQSQSSQSQARIRDLDDFRLIYQEIVSLQEQHRHVYESLAATIDYLNDSPLPQRVDELEAQIERLRYDLAVVRDRLGRSLQIDVTRYEDRADADDLTLTGDVLDEVFETEREREQLDRRTITLPLEQFVSSIEADDAPNSPDFSEFSEGSSLAQSENFDSDAIFDADILTEADDDSAPDVRNSEPSSRDSTALDDRVETESAAEASPEISPATNPEVNPEISPEISPEIATADRRTRTKIELFSPHAAPLADDETADNAIPPIELDASAQTASDTKLGAIAETPSVSFAVPGATPTIPPKAATPAPDLPEIGDPDLAAIARDDEPRVPPQDWQKLSTLTDHGDWVSDLAIDAGGEVLISASFDRTIQFWDIKTGESLNILSEHSSPVCAIALNHDLGWLVSGSWDRTIKIWDFDTQSLLETLVDDSGVAGSVRSLAVSPNGRFVASGWFDRTIAIWEVRITPKRRKVNISACGSQLAHGGRVDAIAFSPTGAYLASASADGTVKLWSVDDNTGELTERQTFSDSADPINAVAFSRDGTLLIDANRDRTIRVWDVETGEQRYRLSEHSGSVTALAIHPDGETLVSASADGTIRLWNLPTGQSLGILTGSRDAVMSVAVSEDGQLIVSGSADGSIDVWRRWGKAELP